MGINFETRTVGTKVVSAIPKMSIDDGINAVRMILKNCWFKKSTTGDLVRHLENYSKKWNEALGKYTGENHNEHSHGADAFRYMAIAPNEYNKIAIQKETMDLYNELENIDILGAY